MTTTTMFMLYVSEFLLVLIPLDQVAEEYRSRGQYFTHLKTVGIQFGIFKDVFGKSFHPKVFTTIRYDTKQVYQGNLLTASEVNNDCYYIYCAILVVGGLILGVLCYN